MSDALEYSGLNTANPLDVRAGASGQRDDREQRFGDDHLGKRVDLRGRQSDERVYGGRKRIQHRVINSYGESRKTG